MLWMILISFWEMERKLKEININDYDNNRKLQEYYNCIYK